MSDDKQLRLHIAERLNEILGVSLVGEPCWRYIIDALFDKSEEEKLVVVFDEFQRLLKMKEKTRINAIHLRAIDWNSFQRSKENLIFL